MKKIAIMSDIHGNSIALAAVLAQIKKQNIHKLIILGDFIGYYHQPNVVVDLLAGADLEIIAVCGNHEQMLAEAMQNKEVWPKINCKYGHGLWLAKERLPQENLNRLLSLPPVRKIRIGNKDTIVSHGVPFNNEGYFYPDSQIEKIDLSILKADILMMGHTHYPLVGFVQNTLVINPGSVGQSRRYGGVAEWAVFYIDTGMVVPQYTPYDVRLVIEDCYEYDKEVPYLVEVLQRGKTT